MVANLRGVAEAAKIKLSTEEKVVIRMPLGGGIEAVLTRQVRAGRRGVRVAMDSGLGCHLSAACVHLLC